MEQLGQSIMYVRPMFYENYFYLYFTFSHPTGGTTPSLHQELASDNNCYKGYKLELMVVTLQRSQPLTVVSKDNQELVEEEVKKLLHKGAI